MHNGDGEVREGKLGAFRPEIRAWVAAGEQLETTSLDCARLS